MDPDELNDKVSQLVWEEQGKFENLDYNGKRALLAKLNMKVIRYSESTAQERNAQLGVMVSISGVS